MNCLDRITTRDPSFTESVLIILGLTIMVFLFIMIMLIVSGLIDTAIVMLIMFIIVYSYSFVCNLILED